jgi:hypothetical protein
MGWCRGRSCSISAWGRTQSTHGYGAVGYADCTAFMPWATSSYRERGTGLRLFGEAGKAPC